MQAAQGKQTAAAIGKAFAKEGYTIGKDTAQMILNLYKNVAAIPTGYFEAKPQRAVGLMKCGRRSCPTTPAAP